MAEKRNYFGRNPAKSVVVESVELPKDTQNEQMKDIFQKFTEFEQNLKQKDKQIEELQKQIQKGDNNIKDDIENSKRRYGYELDGTRRKSESFEYGYKVLIHDKKEKVVIKTETIGRPIVSNNFNTGKRIYLHDLTIYFHD